MIKKLKYFFDFDVFCLNFSFVNMVYNIVCNKLVCIFFWKNFGICFGKELLQILMEVVGIGIQINQVGFGWNFWNLDFGGVMVGFGLVWWFIYFLGERVFEKRFLLI